MCSTSVCSTSAGALSIRPSSVTRRNGINTLTTRVRLSAPDDEKAENTVGEEEQSDQIVRRLRSPERREERRALGQLGDDERGQADRASPDHPTDALVVLRRLVATARQQDEERSDIDHKAA